MFLNFDDAKEIVKEVKSEEPEFNINLLKRVKKSKMQQLS